MNTVEISNRTQKVWDRFYAIKAVWQRSACVPNLRGRIAFMLLSKLYRQMYAGTGISTDSARRKKSKSWARWMAGQCRKFFQAAPMPELRSPVWDLGLPISPIHNPVLARVQDLVSPLVIIRER
jgi:hypothetical protein